MKQGLNQLGQQIVLKETVILTFISDEYIRVSDFKDVELAKSEFYRIKQTKRRGRKPLHYSK